MVCQKPLNALFATFDSLGQYLELRIVYLVASAMFIGVVKNFPFAHFKSPGRPVYLCNPIIDPPLPE